MRVAALNFYLRKPARNLCFRAAGLLALVFLAGCSATKYVPEGDALFWKYTTEIKAPESRQMRKY